MLYLDFQGNVDVFKDVIQRELIMAQSNGVFFRMEGFVV